MMISSKKKLAVLVAASVMMMTPFSVYAEVLNSDTIYSDDVKVSKGKNDIKGLEGDSNKEITVTFEKNLQIQSDYSGYVKNFKELKVTSRLRNNGTISNIGTIQAGKLENNSGTIKDTSEIIADSIKNGTYNNVTGTITEGFITADKITTNELNDWGEIKAGSITITENGSFYAHNAKLDVDTINLKNGALLSVKTDGIQFGTINAGTDTTIDIDTTGNGKGAGTWVDSENGISIDSIAGNGTNIVVDNIEKTDVTIKENKDSNLSITGTEEVTNSFDSNDIAGSLQNLANTINITSGNQTATITASEGDVLGEITAELDKNGNIVESSVSEQGNMITAGIGELANVAFMAWRAENDEMHQRMGELRSSTGEAGIWARMKRGESESGDLDITNQYSTYQLGYDEKVGDSNWYIGGAISRTEGKSSFATGSGENQSTGFTVYGTYVGDDGQYLDLSAKYARLDNEFDVIGRGGLESKGDYRNNGYAFSAEYGKRIAAANDFWIEPQVQLTYGHLSSANYTTSRGVEAAQDAMDSVVGRVGFAAGKEIGAGDVYVKASYLYDFDGDTSVTMSKNGQSDTYEQDLGGGWFEFGIGTNINISETSHLYFDVEKAVGGDIDTPWQWNAGVRFDF